MKFTWCRFKANKKGDGSSHSVLSSCEFLKMLMLKLYVFLSEIGDVHGEKNLPKAITTKMFPFGLGSPLPLCIQALKNTLEKSNFLLALFLSCPLGFYFCQLVKPGYCVRLLLVLSCCTSMF